MPCLCRCCNTYVSSASLGALSSGRSSTWSRPTVTSAGDLCREGSVQCVITVGSSTSFCLPIEIRYNRRDFAKEVPMKKLAAFTVVLFFVLALGSTAGVEAQDTTANVEAYFNSLNVLFPNGDLLVPLVVSISMSNISLSHLEYVFRFYADTGSQGSPDIREFLGYPPAPAPNSYNGPESRPRRVDLSGKRSFNQIISQVFSGFCETVRSPNLVVADIQVFGISDVDSAIVVFPKQITTTINPTSCQQP